jgi:hypothetical protein
MRVRKAWALGAVLAAFAWPSPARAGENGEGAFHRGLKEWEFAAGHGFTLPFGVFEKRTDAPYGLFSARWGRFISSRSEVLLEVPLLYFYEPEDAVGGGASITFRHHLRRGGKVIPFVQISTGVLGTNLDIRELGGSLQFLSHGGVGVRVRTGSRTALLITAEWAHISNAGITRPNTGKDNGLVTIAVARSF